MGGGGTRLGSAGGDTRVVVSNCSIEKWLGLRKSLCISWFLYVSLALTSSGSLLIGGDLLMTLLGVAVWL